MSKPKLNIGDIVSFSVNLTKEKEKFKISDIVRTDYVLTNLDGSSVTVAYPIKLFDELINRNYVDVVKHENGITRALKRILRYGKKTQI